MCVGVGVPRGDGMDRRHIWCWFGDGMDEDDYDLDGPTGQGEARLGNHEGKEGTGKEYVLVPRPNHEAGEQETKGWARNTPSQVPSTPWPVTYRDRNNEEDVLQFSVLFGPTSRTKLFSKAKAMQAKRRALEARHGKGRNDNGVAQLEQAEDRSSDGRKREAAREGTRGEDKEASAEAWLDEPDADECWYLRHADAKGNGGPTQGERTKASTATRKWNATGVESEGGGNTGEDSTSTEEDEEEGGTDPDERNREREGTRRDGRRRRDGGLEDEDKTRRKGNRRNKWWKRHGWRAQWMQRGGEPMMEGYPSSRFEALERERNGLEGKEFGVFSSLHQLPWEENILWEQPEASSGEIEEAKTEKEPNTMRERPLHGWPTCMDDALEEEEECVLALGTQTQLLRLEKATEGRPKSGQETFAFACPNMELESGSWIGRIQWEDKPGVRPVTPLLLDLNDPNMIFQAKPGAEVSNFGRGAAQVVPSLHPDQVKPAAQPSAQIVQACGDIQLALFNLSTDNLDKPTDKKKGGRIGGSFGVRHSLPGATLATMVPHLAPRLVLNFHRPRRLVMPAPLTEAQTQKNLSISFKLKEETVMWVQVRALTGRVETAKIKNTSTGHDLLVALLNKGKSKFDELRRQPVHLCLAGGAALDPTKSLHAQGVRAQSTIWLVCTKVEPLPKRVVGALPTGDMPRRPPAAFQRKRELLTAEKGHVMLVEYLEEFPLLMSNNGMGARLTTFYRKTSANDVGALRLKEKGHGPLGPGHVVALGVDDDPPFLGKLDPGQHIMSFETNMYRSPLHPYKPPKNLFMLIRSSQGKWMIRGVDSTFLAGQEEPHLAVFAPGSQKEDAYGEKRMQVYCYRDFRRRMKNEACPSVRIAEMRKLFPKQSETLIRKRLKHCCDFQRGGDNVGLWSLKADFQIPDEETLRQLMPPEQVCCFEAMRAGQERLVKANIKHLLHMDNRVKLALEQLSDDPMVKKAAKALETELLMTPWSLSGSFVDAIRGGRGMLQIKGRGDPTGRGHGINYLKAPGKSSDQPAPKRENTAGTDADLRRLNMEQAKNILLNFGVTEEEVAKLKRWERIACIREFSNAAAQDGGKLGERLNRFARGTRVSIAQQQEMYSRERNEAFERQRKVLAGEVVPGEATYEDAEDLGKDLEDLLQDEEENEGEEADFQDFKQMLQGGGEGEASEKKAGSKKEKWHNGKRRLRRTIITTFDDGSKHERVEIILDDGKISELKAMRACGGEMKHTAQLLSAEEEERLQEEKRAKRRLQEQRRRLRNKLARQEQEYKLLQSGQGVGTVPPPLPQGRRKRDSRRDRKDLKMKCGACGQVGHMRTNVECPLYGQTMQKERERLAKEPKVKDIAVTHGLKLTLRSDQLETAKDPSFKLKLPVMSSGTKKRSRRGTKRSMDADALFEGSEKWPEPLIKRPRANKPPPPPEHPGRALLRELLFPIFESVHDFAKDSTGELFIKPVSKDVVPDYAKFVPLEKKMDLTKVRSNISKLRYQSSGEFRAHIQQIADNAHAYHDHGGKLAHVGIPPAADALVKRCDELLQQNDKVLGDADSKAALPLQEALAHFGKAELVQTLAPLRNGSVAVSQALRPVIDAVIEHARNTTGELFLKPVSNDFVPDYVLYVPQENKMDLSKMKSYVAKNMYSKSSDFFEHMRQIAVNAHAYHDNGGKLAHSSIPLAADRLVEHCSIELEKHKAAIERAETENVVHPDPPAVGETQDNAMPEHANMGSEALRTGGMVSVPTDTTGEQDGGSNVPLESVQPAGNLEITQVQEEDPAVPTCSGDKTSAQGPPLAVVQSEEGRSHLLDEGLDRIQDKMPLTAENVPARAQTPPPIAEEMLSKGDEEK